MALTLLIPALASANVLITCSDAANQDLSYRFMKTGANRFELTVQEKDKTIAVQKMSYTDLQGTYALKGPNYSTSISDIKEVHLDLDGIVSLLFCQFN